MTRLRAFALATALALCMAVLGPGTASAEPTAPDVGNQQLDVATRGAAPPESNVTTDNQFGYTVQQYLEYMIADQAKVWSQWFEAAGWAQPSVQYHIILPEEPEYKSANCKGVGAVPPDFANAFYCLQWTDKATGQFYGGELVLPVYAFQKMWTGNILESTSTRPGDFGAAIVTAHEFGHHVQDELYWQGYAKDSSVSPPNGKYGELIADCFAGVWMATAYYSGMLENGDFEEGVAAIHAIGDGLNPSVPHGKPEERVEALLTGYNGIPGTYNPATPQACIDKYWR